MSKTEPTAEFAAAFTAVEEYLRGLTTLGAWHLHRDKCAELSDVLAKLSEQLDDRSYDEAASATNLSDAQAAMLTIQSPEHFNCRCESFGNVLMAGRCELKVADAAERPRRGGIFGPVYTFEHPLTADQRSALMRGEAVEGVQVHRAEDFWDDVAADRVMGSKRNDQPEAALQVKIEASVKEALQSTEKVPYTADAFELLRAATEQTVKEWQARGVLPDAPYDDATHPQPKAEANPSHTNLGFIHILLKVKGVAEATFEETDGAVTITVTDHPGEYSDNDHVAEVIARCLPAGVGIEGNVEGQAYGHTYRFNRT